LKEQVDRKKLFKKWVSFGWWSNCERCVSFFNCFSPLF